MRDGVTSPGGNIRFNRKMAGYTQESLAFRLGVDRTTVGKWERGDAFPSATNIRALTKLGMLRGRRERRERRTRKGRRALTPELSDRVMTTFGCHVSGLRSQVGRFQADWERALVAFCRLLSGEQRLAVLELVSLMQLPEAHGASHER